MKTFKTEKRIHMGLTTRHFDESLAFYRTLFAAEPVKLKPGYAKFELEEPPVNFTLTRRDGEGPALSHLGIQVKSREAVTAQERRLQQSGLKTRAERDSTCCYALQDKVWVKDPDGNPWETFVFLEDREASNESATCCR